MLLGLAALLLAIQLVPYGRAHTNPPVVMEPAWDAPATRELVRTACYDCHSNETRWPWYAHVAPASWLVQRDVDEGRAHLNFTEWHLPQEDADDAAEEVRSGAMPQWPYPLLHGGARLTEEQREQLAASFERMFEGRSEGAQPPGPQSDRTP
jgi:mono/diheme cytochrome c family protein